MSLFSAQIHFKMEFLSTSIVAGNISIHIFWSRQWGDFSFGKSYGVQCTGVQRTMFIEHIIFPYLCIYHMILPKSIEVGSFTPGEFNYNYAYHLYLLFYLSLLQIFTFFWNVISLHICWNLDLFPLPRIQWTKVCRRYNIVQMEPQSFFTMGRSFANAERLNLAMPWGNKYCHTKYTNIVILNTQRQQILSY